jgi:hypothetical protein
LIIAGKLRTGTIVGRQVSLDDVRDVIAYCLVRHNRHAGEPATEQMQAHHAGEYKQTQHKAV